MRPERAPQSRAVAGTGRVHTASERGQWSLDRSTSQKSSSFVIQPLSPWLSCKLPTLISGGWRGKARRGPAAARPRRPWRVPAPFRKEPRGRSILHLDLSRRAPSFCVGYQGRGVLFDPRAGRRWWPEGPLNPRRTPEGAGHQLSPEPAAAPGAALPAPLPRARGRQRGGRGPAPRTCAPGRDCGLGRAGPEWRGAASLGLHPSLSPSCPLQVPGLPRSLPLSASLSPSSSLSLSIASQ